MNKRLFVAIDLPEPMQRALEKLDPNMRGVRWVVPNQMHLTLGFFDDVPPETESNLRERLLAISFRPFFLPIFGMGTFPPKGLPKIIWIGVGKGHPHLFQIHKRVQEAALAAGLEPDLRSWHPHVTLGRCGDVPWASVKTFVRENTELDLGLIHIEAFHLYSSKLTSAGPIHTLELTTNCSGSLTVEPKPRDGR